MATVCVNIQNNYSKKRRRKFLFFAKAFKTMFYILYLAYVVYLFLFERHINCRN